MQLPWVVLHIPKEWYEYFKPGTIVDILIKDVSEKTLKSQKIINERVQANPAISNNSLIINIPLDPWRWIGSVKNLKNKTLRISVTPKRMNSNKLIVQYFHFGYFDPAHQNKTQPEIVKQLPMLKVFLEHIRYIEFNEDKSNNISAKNLEIKLSEAKNASNSSISEISKANSRLEDKITQDKNNIDSDLNKDLSFNENIKEGSRLKNKAYIDRLITIVNDAIEASWISTRKKNANEKRTLFKKSWLSYNDLDSVPSFNSNIDLNRINEEIKIYEEGNHNFLSKSFTLDIEKGKQKLMIEFKDKIVKVEGYQQIKIILDKLRPHKSKISRIYWTNIL